MARSKYIYMVQVVGDFHAVPWAFTVKHEALRAIANSTMSNSILRLYRVLDAAYIGLGNDNTALLDLERELSASGYIKTKEKEG